MAAKKGNKYAQKHTRDDVLRILNDAIDGLTKLDQKTVISKSGEAVEIDYFRYTSLERALATNRVGREKPYRWLETWKDDEEVCHTIKDLLDINKTSLIANTLDGNVVASAGIFIMKAVHNMSDQPKEVAVVEETTMDLSKLSPKQLKDYIKLQTLIEAKGD